MSYRTHLAGTGRGAVANGQGRSDEALFDSAERQRRAFNQTLGEKETLERERRRGGLQTVGV